MKLLLAVALSGHAQAFRNQHRHALRAVAAKNFSYGNPGCPCVGLDFEKGSYNMGEFGTYPSNMGAHCAPWAKGSNPECKGEGEDPDFCGQPWCFVDPCNCNGIPAPPRAAPTVDVIRQGMPVYYSYSTCGGEDTWTASHDDKNCLNAKTEEACGKAEDCIWEESAWGKMCLGWEAAGLCGGIPEEKTWGNASCPCIGMNGINGTLKAEMGDGVIAEYPVDLASVCKAWDNEYSPACQGEDKAEGCDQPWCYVDTARCEKAKTAKSTYLPGATYQGRALHYSYEACGGKHPEKTAQEHHEDHEPKAVAEAAKEEEVAEEAAEPEAEAAAEPAEPEDEAAEPEAEDGEDSPPEETPAPAAMDIKYDQKEYNEDWHNEWENGNAPTFQDMHPEIKDFVDRQSDGVPSPVG